MPPRRDRQLDQIGDHAMAAPLGGNSNMRSISNGCAMSRTIRETPDLGRPKRKPLISPTALEASSPSVQSTFGRSIASRGGWPSAI